MRCRPAPVSQIQVTLSCAVAAGIAECRNCLLRSGRSVDAVEVFAVMFAGACRSRPKAQGTCTTGILTSSVGHSQVAYQVSPEQTKTPVCLSLAREKVLLSACRHGLPIAGET